MNPIDVVRTRYYNQTYVDGKGTLYVSGLDAMKKIADKEGFSAFYKGFTTHFLRIGPHFCLTFVFLGVLRRTACDFYGYLDHRDIFEEFDTDHNGKLDEQEVRALLVRALGPHTSQPQIPVYLERVINRADHDKDKMISFQEYTDLEREVIAIVKERSRD
jgi:Ca2+-binding EF-hand superfamily protein